MSMRQSIKKFPRKKKDVPLLPANFISKTVSTKRVFRSNYEGNFLVGEVG